MLNVVLVEPEIPPNTGNVARLCAATKCKLHLIGPLGFRMDESALKRAGMDYWELVDYQIWKNWDDFFEVVKEKDFFLLSSKAKNSIYEQTFPKDCYLIFGRETKGLPESLLEKYENRAVKIPMLNEEARCLNLATSVGIVVYEALRKMNIFHHES
jgi:tRNA (cytidine/uridine-2'-O-)-methyltransferase